MREEESQQYIPDEVYESGEQYPPLSDNQQNLIQDVSAGLTDPEIAEKKHVSFGTVRLWLSGDRGVFNLLDVTTREAAVGKAIELGYIDVESVAESFIFTAFDKLNNTEIRVFEAATAKENLQKNHAEIADELQISEQTIKNTLSQIYNKLGIRNRVHAVVYRTSLEMGLDKDR